MINFERYKNEISEAMNGHYTTFGFQDMKECLKQIADVDMAFWSDAFYWGLQEWDPQLSDIDKFLLKNLDSKWLWIARDKSGMLNIFSDYPVKTEVEWNCNIDETDYVTINLEICKAFGMAEEDLFSFIKWQDEKPWSIKELKKMMKG